MKSKKLKIAIVSLPSLSGAVAVATELGLELASRGHKVHFIASDMLFRLEGGYHQNITFHLVEDVSHLSLKNGSLHVLTLANKIAEVCRRYDIDIIHSHYAVPNAVSAIIARDMPGTKAKVINTFHGTDVTNYALNLNVKELLSHVVNQCDGLTAVANAQAKTAIENFAITDPSKLQVIHNWVKPQTHSPKQEKELRDLFAHNHEKIIIHVSNFREIKRIQDVIEVYRGIDRKVPSKLLLVGDGPEQRIAYRLISKYKLMNKVHILGVQANVNRILSISDLFLLPSQSEAFSLAALEAMSFGVPVIATNVGGMSEMIEDGESGFIAEVGDIDNMIRKGIDMLSNPQLHHKIQQNAINKVTTEYSPELIIPKYEKFYYEILAKN